MIMRRSSFMVATMLGIITLLVVALITSSPYISNTSYMFKAVALKFSATPVAMGCNGFTCYVLMRGGYLAVIDEITGGISESVKISMNIGNETLIANAMCVAPQGNIALLLTDVGKYHYVAIAYINGSTLKPVWTKLWKLNRSLQASPIMICALHEIIVMGLPNYFSATAINYNGALLWIVTTTTSPLQSHGVVPVQLTPTINVPITLYSDLIPFVITNIDNGRQAIIIFDARNLKPVYAFTTKLIPYSYAAKLGTAIVVLADLNYVARKVIVINTNTKKASCLVPPPIVLNPLPAIVAGSPIIVGINGKRSVIVSIDLQTGSTNYFPLGYGNSTFEVEDIWFLYGMGNPIAMKLISYIGGVVVFDEKRGNHTVFKISTCDIPQELRYVVVVRLNKSTGMTSIAPSKIIVERASIGHSTLHIWFNSNITLTQCQLGKEFVMNITRSATIYILSSSPSLSRTSITYTFTSSSSNPQSTSSTPSIFSYRNMILISGLILLLLIFLARRGSAREPVVEY